MPADIECITGLLMPLNHSQGVGRHVIIEKESKLDADVKNGSWKHMRLAQKEQG
jgi:hypothetical protein